MMNAVQTKTASYKGHEIVTTLAATEEGNWLPCALVDGKQVPLCCLSHKNPQDAYGRAFRTARDYLDREEQ